jgi:hypothetical protein
MTWKAQLRGSVAFSREAVAGCSGMAFGLSLALPVFRFDGHEPVLGITVLAWGWWGFLLGEIGWLANLIFFFALSQFVTEKVLISKVASTAAVVVGITSFHAKQWWFDEGNATAILTHGLGFYLWLVSLLILSVGSWVVLSPVPGGKLAIDDRTPPSGK